MTRDVSISYRDGHVLSSCVVGRALCDLVSRYGSHFDAAGLSLPLSSFWAVPRLVLQAENLFSGPSASVLLSGTSSLVGYTPSSHRAESFVQTRRRRSSKFLRKKVSSFIFCFLGRVVLPLISFLAHKFNLTAFTINGGIVNSNSCRCI